MTDVDDSADAAAPDQQGTRLGAAIGAVVAHVADDANAIAQIPARVHQRRARPMADSGMVVIPEARFNTAKTFSVSASERTKSS